jgi:hypothetical protein
MEAQAIFFNRFAQGVLPFQPENGSSGDLP